jgi:hypothetical protein
MMKSTETVRIHKVSTRTTTKRSGEVRTVERVRVRRDEKRTTVRGKPNGVILYRGPSLLDGQPIVCIATGLARRSKNPKTGRMVQTYVLADGTDPVSAHQQGKDKAVCGDCPHLSGTCHVNLVQGPLAVWKAYQAGSYPRLRREHLRLFRGRMLRLGTYGDPAAVPLSVWQGLTALVTNWTGYTHAWRTCDAAYAAYCMASVETPAQRLAAVAAGYRTFRVRLATQPLEPGEFVCPASAEAGKRRTCEECKACSGSKAGGRNATPAIVFHGPAIAGNYRLRRYETLQQQLLRDEEQILAAGRLPLALVS